MAEPAEKKTRRESVSEAIGATVTGHLRITETIFMNEVLDVLPTRDVALLSRINKDSSHAWSMISELTLPDDFNEDVGNLRLPIQLRELTFGRSFNQRLDDFNFPHGLVRLVFQGFDVEYCRFNQSIDRVTFPHSLKVLALGSHFNQPIHNVTWPLTLRELSFGLDFNQPMDEVSLPDSLERLAFGYDFQQRLQHLVLPIYLRSLSLHPVYSHSIGDLRPNVVIRRS